MDRRLREFERAGEEAEQLKELHRKGVMPFWKLELLAWLGHEPALELASAPDEVRLIDAVDLVTANPRIQARVESAFSIGAISWFGHNLYSPQISFALTRGARDEDLAYPLGVIDYLRDQSLSVTWARYQGAGFFPDRDYLNHLSDVFMESYHFPGHSVMGSFCWQLANLLTLFWSGAPGARSTPMSSVSIVTRLAAFYARAITLSEDSLYRVTMLAREEFEREAEAWEQRMGGEPQSVYENQVARAVLEKYGKEFLLRWLMVDRDPWLERTT